jgi:uncharacterized membrane protein YeaQ/YmgE (transglycosylase-associated protein family)
MHVLLFILVGLVAGALAGRVVSGHGYGMVGNFVVGVLGAILGGWMFTSFAGVTGGGVSLSLFTALLGAVALLWAVRLVAPARGSHP